MRMTPSEYLELPRLVLRAAIWSREKSLGAALQGLHALEQGTATPRAG